jgi:Uma2 family endonuclease
MNEFVHFPKMRATTQAADGVPRLHWTLVDFERLVDAGIVSKEDRIELIGGELIPMSPKGNRHELVRDDMVNWMFRRMPLELRLSSELGWRPNAETYLEPDILIGLMALPGPTMPPSQVRLAIEIADSSLKFDSGLKSRVYAMLGVREYWVVNAVTLETTVFREPAEGGYAGRVQLPATETLTPHLVPDLALRLGELGLG